MSGSVGSHRPGRKKPGGVASRSASTRCAGECADHAVGRDARTDDGRTPAIHGGAAVERGRSLRRLLLQSPGASRTLPSWTSCSLVRVRHSSSSREGFSQAPAGNVLSTAYRATSRSHTPRCVQGCFPPTDRWSAAVTDKVTTQCAGSRRTLPDGQASKSDRAINLRDKLTRFSEHWSPRVIAEMNDYQFKLAKGKCTSYPRAWSTGRLRRGNAASCSWSPVG